MPSPIRKLKDTLRAWSLKKRILVVLCLASILLFTFHLVEWGSAELIEDATILEVRRAAPGHRDGTLRRYELKVLHRGVVLHGIMNTYWFTGKPEAGQVLDLRKTQQDKGYYRFHHGAWTLEFRSWFVMLAVFGLVWGAWEWITRRRRSN